MNSFNEIIEEIQRRVGATDLDDAIEKMNKMPDVKQNRNKKKLKMENKSKGGLQLWSEMQTKARQIALQQVKEEHADKPDVLRKLEKRKTEEEGINIEESKEDKEIKWMGKDI